MGERGKNYLAESNNIHPQGVRVVTIDKTKDDQIAGDVVFKSETSGLADEFMARGITRHFNKEGVSTAIIFHPEHPFARGAKDGKT